MKQHDNDWTQPGKASKGIQHYITSSAEDDLVWSGLVWLVIFLIVFFNVFCVFYSFFMMVLFLA